MTRLEPVHPGEILKHDFMEPLGLSTSALAREIGVAPKRIGRIVCGERGITAEIALRLAHYFGVDAQSWMNLQSSYELAMAKQAGAAALRAIRQRGSTKPSCPNRRMSFRVLRGKGGYTHERLSRGRPMQRRLN